MDRDREVDVIIKGLEELISRKEKLAVDIKMLTECVPDLGYIIAQNYRRKILPIKKKGDVLNGIVNTLSKLLGIKRTQKGVGKHAKRESVPLKQVVGAKTDAVFEKVDILFEDIFEEYASTEESGNAENVDGGNGTCTKAAENATFEKLGVIFEEDEGTEESGSAENVDGGNGICTKAAENAIFEKPGVIFEEDAGTEKSGSAVNVDVVEGGIGTKESGRALNADVVEKGVGTEEADSTENIDGEKSVGTEESGSTENVDGGKSVGTQTADGGNGKFTEEVGGENLTRTEEVYDKEGSNNSSSKVDGNSGKDESEEWCIISGTSSPQHAENNKTDDSIDFIKLVEDNRLKLDTNGNISMDWNEINDKEKKRLEDPSSNN